jgi:uncharacterized membrane protein
MADDWMNLPWGAYCFVLLALVASGFVSMRAIVAVSCTVDGWPL